MTGKAHDIPRAWFARGFSCGLWTDPPGKQWKDYVHRSDEMIALIEGEIEVRIGDEVHRPKVGEELLIPAGMRHTVTNVGSTPNRWLYGYRATRG